VRGKLNFRRLALVLELRHDGGTGLATERPVVIPVVQRS